jgi:hypothetical protein
MLDAKQPGPQEHEPADLDRRPRLHAQQHGAAEAALRRADDTNANTWHAALPQQAHSFVPVFATQDRQLGVYAALAVVLLELAYAVTLVAGLRSLASPDEPISGPLFTALELLILLLMPPMIALMVAVHAWAPVECKSWSGMALVFMALMAGLTSVVHWTILTLGQQPAFAELPWLPLLFAFRWPSLVYALDILAWDVFFALAVLCAAPVFRGNRLAVAIRWLLILSGVLALAGLSGVMLGDMQWRNIGIVGYVGVFPVVALLLALLFRRSQPQA